MGKAKIAGGLVTGCVGATAALGYYDEGVGRSQTFWARAFPIFLRYRWVQFLSRDMGYITDEDATARYEALHEICSPKVQQLCTEMRGFYLKNAQMMATREDFLPAQYIKWMRETEDQAPTPFAPGDAEKIVAEELGRPLEEVFSFFDTEPTGVASIGQVHRAILKETGAEVAVKVQHWGAEELFSGDIRTQKNFCKYFMPQHVPAFDEIEKAHLTEFNYAAEAENLDLIRKQLTPIWGDKIVVPASFPQFCTKRVLTMEYLHGVKLVEGIRRSYKDVADRLGKTLEEIESEQKAKIKSGELQLKSIRGESEQAQKVRTAIRMQDYAMNALRVLANFTPIPYLLSLLKEGRISPLPMKWTTLPLNLGDIIGLLVDVHADQLFTFGSFNGDPHPGNILLLNDGRLGLIDFGQVKHLGDEPRTAIAQMVVSLAAGDKLEVAKGFKALGSKTKYGDNEVAYRLGAFWFDRDTDDIMTWNGKVLNIADFLDAMEAADPVEVVPDNLIMAGRMVILLRGLGLALGMRLRMGELMEPRASAYLQTQNA